MKIESFGDKSFSEESHECKTFWMFMFINFEKNWREVYRNGTPKGIFF